MTLPTYTDISPTNGVNLDEKSALRHFLGKSSEAASVLFVENAFHYQEYLRCMGDKAFAYYLPALLVYLKSDRSKFDADIVNAIVGTSKMRLEQSVSCSKASKDAIFLIVNYCLNYYSKFNIDLVSYGDLKNELEILRNKCC